MSKEECMEKGCIVKHVHGCRYFETVTNSKEVSIEKTNVDGKVKGQSKQPLT
jgi:hypothetical protein